MHLHSGRAGKIESALAALILLVLIGIAVGVYVRQRDVNMARFGIGSGAPATAGFSPVGNAETYDTDNLYEKIDGKAPMYQETGFVRLTTQRFAGEANPEIGFEQYVYDMGNTRNAFSVYSRQKRADTEDLPGFGTTGFGYKTSNAIYVSYGRYYIEMIGFAESDELIDAMRDIAQKLVAQLPSDEKDRIAELGFFPPEGTIAGSWKLQIRDAFGFDGLTDTYSAQYKTDGQTVTIFFSKRKDAPEAQKVAKSYSDFLVTNGAKLTPNIKLGAYEADASVLDFYGSIEIVFSAGPFVGGVHEADDRQAAEKAAEVLFERLNKISGEIGG